MHRFLLTTALALVLLAGCKKAEKPSPVVEEKGATGMALVIKSNAFENGATIPKKYTCDGQDLSPPLSWTGIPEETKSLALICDDPDAPMGTWTHWVLWGLPPSAPALPEGVPADSVLPGGMYQGLNSWPKAGYGGPCPPPGKPHRYFFKLYALDNVPELPTSANKAGLENAMKGHILDEAQVMGTYGR
ncbi:MAG: YbhB/YbcL family Raf kinase inhibitor-like protein [Calditrichota bacterium]